MDTLSPHTKPERRRWRKDLYSSWPQDRLDAIAWEGRVRRVECPRCGALVGEDCCSASSYVTQFHVARVRAAEASE